MQFPRPVQGDSDQDSIFRMAVEDFQHNGIDFFRQHAVCRHGNCLRRRFDEYIYDFSQILPQGGFSACHEQMIKGDHISRYFFIFLKRQGVFVRVQVFPVKAGSATGVAPGGHEERENAQSFLLFIVRKEIFQKSQIHESFFLSAAIRVKSLLQKV